MDIGETLLVRSAQEWRAWLAQHHKGWQAIWLIYYKKMSGQMGISSEEPVDEALCLGWIDGAIRRKAPGRNPTVRAWHACCAMGV